MQIRIALCTAGLAALLACAGSAAIPRSDYASLEQGDGSSYELRTRSGQVYVISHFDVTPDSIVLHDENQHLAIPMSDVESIRPIRTASHGKSVAIGIVAVSVFAVVGFLVVDSLSQSW